MPYSPLHLQCHSRRLRWFRRQAYSWRYFRRRRQESLTGTCSACIGGNLKIFCITYFHFAISFLLLASLFSQQWQICYFEGVSLLLFLCHVSNDVTKNKLWTNFKIYLYFRSLIFLMYIPHLQDWYFWYRTQFCTNTTHLSSSKWKILQKHNWPRSGPCNSASQA